MNESISVLRRAASAKAKEQISTMDRITALDRRLSKLLEEFAEVANARKDLAERSELAAVFSRSHATLFRLEIQM